MAGSIKRPLTDFPNLSVVNSTALAPGDIIFSTGSGVESWLIRTATASPTSHVALHIGAGVAIEANDPGVVPVYLPALGYTPSAKLRVCRLPGLSLSEQEDIARFAQTLLYRPYSTTGAIATQLPALRNQRDPGYFCSQLVAAAYESVGKSLCENKRPSEVTPGDLAASQILTGVPTAIRNIPSIYHFALTERFQHRYSSYINDGNIMEKNITKALNNVLPNPPFYQAFNIFDFPRQLELLKSVDNIRTRCDLSIAKLIFSVSDGKLKARFPGLNIINYFKSNSFDFMGNEVWTNGALTNDVGFRVYYADFHEALLSAYVWETRRRKRNVSALFEAAERTKLYTYSAIAKWGGREILNDIEVWKLAASVTSTEYMQTKLHEHQEAVRRDREALIAKDKHDPPK
jgi:uncharacterized protein YycO